MVSEKCSKTLGLIAIKDHGSHLLPRPSQPRKPKIVQDSPELDYDNLQRLIDQEDGEWSEDPEYVNLDEMDIKVPEVIMSNGFLKSLLFTLIQF